MKIALKILTQKKLGTLIVKNKKGYTTGIITDGQIRKIGQKTQNLHNLKVRQVMTKNPIKVDKDILAQKALAIMNEKKITSLCVFKSKKKSQTIGIIHIHNILEANIY
jgi:arabinose-5-phosphate isomerase